MENLKHPNLQPLTNRQNLFNEKITEIHLQQDQVKLSIGTNAFTLSWGKSGLSKLENSIKFDWCEMRFNLKAIGTYGSRSTTIRADLEFLNQRYVWGIGRGSVGGGGIGIAPKIRVGNYTLNFSFGTHHVQILELEISPELNDVKDLRNPCFKFIL